MLDFRSRGDTRRDGNAVAFNDWLVDHIWRVFLAIGKDCQPAKMLQLVRQAFRRVGVGNIAQPVAQPDCMHLPSG